MARNIFILKNGTKVETDRFMQGPALTKGYVWHNTAKSEDDFNCWEERVAPPVQNETLFGYPVKEFLAKQYKQLAA